jgi:hypothetical protein
MLCTIVSEHPGKNGDDDIHAAVIQRDKEPFMRKIDLPAGSRVMLKKLGFARVEIAAVSEQIYRHKPQTNGSWKNESKPGYCTFNPTGLETVCDDNIKYLKKGYEADFETQNSLPETPEDYARALAEVVKNNPGRAKRVAKNFLELKEGKKGLDYINGAFIKNMDDFAYTRVDVSDLRLQVFPEWRYGINPGGGRDNRDPLGLERPGSMDLANFICAYKNKFPLSEKEKRVSGKDFRRAKKLAPLIYEHPPKCDEADIREFKEIIRKAPNYCANEMVWHEDQGGRFIYLVPSGKFHSGGSGAGSYVHCGGQEILRTAWEINKEFNESENIIQDMMSGAVLTSGLVQVWINRKAGRHKWGYMRLYGDRLSFISHGDNPKGQIGKMKAYTTTPVCFNIALADIKKITVLPGIRCQVMIITKNNGFFVIFQRLTKEDNETPDFSIWKEQIRM